MSTECAIRRISDIRSHLNSVPTRLHVAFDDECVIPKSRVALANFFIKEGDFTFDVFDTLDVNLFLLKIISPSQYQDKIVRAHLRSTGELCEYDPPKNGQNILKHGLSFSESASLSNSFGAIMVPIKEKEEERLAIFYELTIDAGRRKLNYPFSTWPIEASILILTIVDNSGLLCRFVSSRRINSKNLQTAVAGALRAVDIDDPVVRKNFHDHCTEMLREHLRCFA